jgi:hypothetical protein
LRPADASWPELHQRQADIAQYAGKQIVEIVRDTARKSRHGLQFLAFEQLPLQRFAFGHVGDHRGHRHDLSRLVKQRSMKPFTVDHAAVFGA